MKDKRTLMQRLLDAGYPREEMFNHYGDLYVYVTPLTRAVLNAWAKDNGFNRFWFCPIFEGQITGRPMFDCAFQYDDYWQEADAKGAAQT